MVIRKRAKRMGRREITKLLKGIPEAIAGRGEYKVKYIRTRFFANFANHFFTKLSEAYEAKSEGGTDEFGNSWKPISERTKIYRRLTRQERRQFGVGSNKGRGLLTLQEDREWKRTFAMYFHRFSYTMGEKAAKALAARLAWVRVKQMGAKTKKEMFKGRKATILVETGRLKKSFKPSSISTGYYRPNKDQIAVFQSSTITLGTKVPYASYVDKDRPLFPKPDQYQKWIDEGVQKAVDAILKEIVANIQ